MPRLLVGGIPKERAGEARLAYRRLGIEPSGEIHLTSDAFGHGEPIPTRYTADGRSDEPTLRWNGVPAQAQSLALVAEDPDAPTPQPFVHWLLYGIPAQATSTDEAHALGAKLGKNSMWKPAWAGCAPPKGDLAHRYFFQLFVLDRYLELPPRVGRSALLFAMGGHLLGCAILIGTYKR
ncbi:MAG TPA: YbhB/YbcL family Raf kinase inhibitor-like protein [Myxococcales bacterium]|nr:YbhB/YbcL family Raf kinase inhibitor-like protein [Myxococcales bacterium]